MAAVDDDILKTLKRIEVILGRGSTTTGLGRTATVAGGADRTAGSGRSANRQPIDRDTNELRKTFRASTAALKTLTDSSGKLTMGFGNLNKTIVGTRGQFVSLNRTMRSLPRTLTLPETVVPPTPPAPAVVPATPARQPREDSAEGARRRTSNAANKKLLKLPAFFDELISELRRGLKVTSIPPQPGQPGGPPAPTPTPIPPQPGQPGGPAGPPAPSNSNSNAPRIDRPAAGARDGLNGVTDASVRTRSGLLSFAAILAAAVIPVTKDFLMLHRYGIQASSALGGMYVDAALAGMSLENYTKLLHESSVAVTRFSSMDAFNDALQGTNNRLAGLGIFGEQATKLSATLYSSSTALGIPQAQLAEATARQVDIFADLRKASLMTAEQFQEMTKTLSENQTVQSQLLGMAPAQRATRFNELIQIKSIGLSMGSTKKASDELGEALIATRNLTAPKRFESAGRIRQAGAMLGMGAGETETLARLSRKKIRTPEEERQFTAIGGRLQAAIERASQSGDITQENMAEQLQAALDSAGIGDALKKAGNVGMAEDSARARSNADFAKGASGLLQAVGRLDAFLNGFKQNNIVKALGTAAVGGAIGAAVAGAIRGTLRGLLPSFGGGAGGPGGRPPLLPGGGGLQAIFPTFSKIITGTVELLRSGAGRLASVYASVRALLSGGTGPLTVFDRMSIAFSNFATTLRGVSANVAGAMGAVQNWFGSILPAIRNFSPMIGGALDSVGGVIRGIGTRVGGWLSSIGGAFRGLFSGIGGSIIGGFIRRIPVISAVWDAVVELFTGTITAAFNPNGDANWGEVFGNMVFAVFNGFVGGVGKLVDWIISFFSEDGLHVENALNVLMVGMKTLALSFMDKTLSWIPGVGKYFENAAKDSGVVLDKLLADNTMTVSKIGEQNNKEIDSKKKTTAATKDQADKTKAAQAQITASQAGILNSTIGITSDIISTARMVATPAPTPVKNVTEPTVNRDEAETPTDTDRTTAETAAATTPQTDAIVSQLIAMNGLLASMLSAEELQAAGITALASAAGRPTFANNETRFELLQGSRYTG